MTPNGCLYCEYDPETGYLDLCEMCLRAELEEESDMANDEAIRELEAEREMVAA